MKVLKIFAIMMMLFAVSSCGKSEQSSQNSAEGKADSGKVSEIAKPYVGVWEVAGYFNKLELNLKEDGTYEIAYFQQYEFDANSEKAATASGKWDVKEITKKRNEYNEEGKSVVVEYKVKNLVITPDEENTKFLCPEDEKDNVSSHFASMLSGMFNFEDGVGTMMDVKINSNGVKTLLEAGGMTKAEKAAAPAAVEQKNDAPEVVEAVGEDLTYSVSGTVAGKNVAGTITIAGDGAVSGEYCYEGSTAAMTLSGTYFEHDRVAELNESYDGKETGKWSCTVAEEGKEIVISGTMVNFKGKEYKVELSGSAN